MLVVLDSKICTARVCSSCTPSWELDPQCVWLDTTHDEHRWTLLDAVWGCRLCCSLSTKHGGSHRSSTKCLLPNTIYMSEQTDLGYPTRKNKPQGWRETVTQSTKVASSSQGPGELALLSGVVVCKSCASVGWCGPEVGLIKDFLKKAPSWSALR